MQQKLKMHLFSLEGYEHGPQMDQKKDIYKYWTRGDQYCLDLYGL